MDRIVTLYYNNLEYAPQYRAENIQYSPNIRNIDRQPGFGYNPYITAKETRGMENPATNRRSEYNPLRSLFKKWDNLSKNLQKYPVRAPILLPDLFVCADRGVEFTRLIDELNEFLLARKNLMDFYGDVDHFEFFLNYCSPDAGFTEIVRLMNEVKAAAGFRNHFKGIVHIGIDDWIGHHEETYFSEFLSYLSENSRNWLIVLSVTDDPDRHDGIEEMRSVVSMFLRVEHLQIKLPGAEHYLDMLEGMLEGYGISLDDDARKAMLASIKVLRRNRYFSGEFNINCLADDIVYTLYSLPGSPAKLLTKADLEGFTASSDYIKRTIIRMQKKNTIGFNN